MMIQWSRSKRAAAVAVLAVLPAAFAFGQMGGGMMGSGSQEGMMQGGSGQSSGSNGMMGSGAMTGSGTMMGNNGMMSAGSMGAGAMSGLTVAADGTPYILRTITSQTTQPAQIVHELTALDPLTGATKWKLDITGNQISQPVLGKDGQLFLTAGDFAMYQSGQSTGTQSKARLLVVSAAGVLVRTTEVDSTMLSAPVVAGDAPNSVIYAVGFDAGTSASAGSMMNGTRTLYSFNPDGTLKFQVKLDQ